MKEEINLKDDEFCYILKKESPQYEIKISADRPCIITADVIEFSNDYKTVIFKRLVKQVGLSEEANLIIVAVFNDYMSIERADGLGV